MEPEPGFTDEGSRDPVLGGSPFSGISVEAGERLSVTVAGTGQPPSGGNGDGSARDFAPVRERARRDGIAIEIEPAANGTRVGWSVPLRPVP